MINLTTTLQDLARDRPIFHSEADFQHALAWKLQSHRPRAAVRLEYKPFPSEPFFIDIWMRTTRGTVAIELKYLARKAEVVISGESYYLKDQAAQDIIRYDCVKDISRLERVVAAHVGVVGYSIALRNDRSYWQPGGSRSTIDEAFRIHEGRMLSGPLSWSAAASPGSTRGREEVLHIRGNYMMQWDHYSTVPAVTNNQFRYLLVRVPIPEIR